MNAYAIRVMVGRKVVESTISAATIASAKEEASRRGQVLSVKRAGRGRNNFDRMALADRLIFFQRLSSMLAARVGTSEALDVIYQSFTGPVREASRILRDRIVDGSELYDAMTFAGPRYFPEAVVAIIKTGSKGGDMAYALREAVRFESELAQVKKESTKGLMSALSGYVAGVITILASTMYVAPEIMNSSFITASTGADIGWVMTMADIITWIALGSSAVVFLMALFAYVVRPMSPATVDRIVLKIPFYRDMVLAKTNYMVFFGLAVLLKAGLRVEEAMMLTIEAAPRGELRNDLERACTALVKGGTRPWPYEMNMLHPTDKAALATAQDKEQIALTIEDLAHQYRALYRSRMELFVPAMQAFSAIFLSLAGFVLFAVSVIPLMQGSSSILKMI